MKLLHLSDLHIGKRVHEFSMLADQRYILEEILQIAKAEKVDGVLLSGDIYDKAVPSGEAVQLCDWFLTALVQENLSIFIISGNHDSPERLSFGAQLLNAGGVHISPPFNGSVEKVRLQDEFGAVDIYLLPYLKPAHVRPFFPDTDISDYDSAVRAVVDSIVPDTAARNVILSHQFVTGAARSESEELSIGGLEDIAADIFHAFDYVALGHIHRPQSVGGRDTLRYCGTPLKYSFSEAGHQKSVTLVELKEKGRVELSFLPLTPLHDMREIRGSYEELTLRSSYAGTDLEDYLHVTLTDEEEVPNALGKLRGIYKNIMKLDYDNIRTRSYTQITATEDLPLKTPLALFEELYYLQNNQSMTAPQRDLVLELLEEIQEAKRCDH